MNFEYLIEGMSPDDVLGCGAIKAMRAMTADGIPLRITIAPNPIPAAIWIDLFSHYLNVQHYEEQPGNGCVILLSAAERTLH